MTKRAKQSSVLNVSNDKSRPITLVTSAVSHDFTFSPQVATVPVLNYVEPLNTSAFVNSIEISNF